MDFKEKAKELIDKFYAPDSTSLDQDLYRAKGNAFICVNEMIEMLDEMVMIDYRVRDVFREELKQIMIEIGKL